MKVSRERNRLCYYFVSEGTESKNKPIVNLLEHYIIHNLISQVWSCGT